MEEGSAFDGSSILGNRHWYRAESPDGQGWRVVVGYRGNILRLPESISTMPLRSAVLTFMVDLLSKPFSRLPGRRIGVFEERGGDGDLGRCRYKATVASVGEADRAAVQLRDELRSGIFRWDPVRSAKSTAEMNQIRSMKVAERQRPDNRQERIVRAFLAAVVGAAALWSALANVKPSDRFPNILLGCLTVVVLVDVFRSICLGKPREHLVGTEMQIVVGGLALGALLLATFS